VEAHPFGVRFHKPKKSTNDLGLLYAILSLENHYWIWVLIHKSVVTLSNTNVRDSKTQKMSGGAKRRHSSFGFYALSKTYIAIGFGIPYL